MGGEGVTMPERPWVAVERVRRVRIEVPKLAATIEVSSCGDEARAGRHSSNARLEDTISTAMVET